MSQDPDILGGVASTISTIYMGEICESQKIAFSPHDPAVSLIPILLCQSPFKRWDIFLHSLESGPAACLLWLIEFSRNETFWVLSSVLNWPRISYFLSHGMLPLGTPSLQIQTSCCKKRPCMGILLAGSTIPSTSHQSGEEAILNISLFSTFRGLHLQLRPHCHPMTESK